MKMLNKSDLVSRISEKAGLSKKDASNALNATINSIREALAHREGVQLVGFGHFVVRHRRARGGRNPQTGQSIQIPAHNIPAFKPGKNLKNAIK